MVLEDFLFPQEVIKYQSKKDVKYGGADYILYITNRRVIGHKRKGLLRKKDKVFSVALEEITNLKYDEKGLISKKGTLTIETETQKIPFEGKIDDVKVIWQEMQQFLQMAEGIGAQTASSKILSSSGDTNMVVEVNNKDEENPLSSLKMRLAKGEITEEEFQRTKALLES